MTYQNNRPRCRNKQNTLFSRCHQFDGTDTGFRHIPCEKGAISAYKRIKYYKLCIARKLRTWTL